MAEVGDEVRVIGTKGDYYYVLLGDGSVGCPVSYTHLDVYKRQPQARL